MVLNSLDRAKDDPTFNRDVFDIFTRHNDSGDEYDDEPDEDSEDEVRPPTPPPRHGLPYGWCGSCPRGPGAPGYNPHFDG